MSAVIHCVSYYASALRLRWFFVLLLASSAGFTQTVSNHMVDVGEHRLYVSQAGSGRATVVFESGLGEDSSTWSKVQPRVAKFSHTVTYDRAGLGKSDALPPPAHPRTVKDMAGELHSLLHAAKVAPPFVLVGHSLGGTIVQVFAHSYPSETAGLVLVDPEDSRLTDLLHSRMTAADWSARQKAMDAAMSDMPPGVKAEQDAAFKTSGLYAAESIPLPDVPVILLTGTKKNPEFPGNPLEQDLKLELQKALLATIAHGKQVLAPNSRHYIQNDQPELVIDAIRELSVSQDSINSTANIDFISDLEAQRFCNYAYPITRIGSGILTNKSRRTRSISPSALEMWNNRDFSTLPRLRTRQSSVLQQNS